VNLPENSDAAKQRLAKDVLASMGEAVAVVLGEDVVYANEAFTRLFGYTAEELGGAKLRELIVPEARWQESAQLIQTVDQAGSASVETIRRNKAGGIVDVAVEAAPLVVNGAKAGYVLTYRDISER